jgi:ssRNA-specific RNase YbeY (16S rRNA maturation enzyme)
MIKIFTRSNYKINKKKVTAKINSYLKEVGFDGSCLLNVIFFGRRKMKEIARKYRKEDLALPVLSFSYLNNNTKEEEKLIAEIFICYPQAVLIAVKREREVDNIIIELIRHGINNIIGSGQ